MLFYFTLYGMKLWLLPLLVFCIRPGSIYAQEDSVPAIKSAIKANRIITYHNIINNSIIKNLSFSLSDSTEENWQDAFYSIELVRYRSRWADRKVKEAIESADIRSVSFQRALLELLYANYLKVFIKEVKGLLYKVKGVKNEAMCIGYLKASGVMIDNKMIHAIIPINEKDSVILQQLRYHIKNKNERPGRDRLAAIFKKSFLPGNTLLISIQRKDRNYPGIALVRDKEGNFAHDAKGNILFVAQLARSISNLPGYISYGNTPQGIFRMNGFDISKSLAIGPTTNIQLMMPYETSIQYFLKDSTITDPVWTEELYKRLLPGKLQSYLPLFETYYASKAGRTEIIAHGTTIDPAWYKGQPYYPNTPTVGCLCAGEIWSEQDGRRIKSDQQRLVDILKTTGGADGYCIVIEIDDSTKPVSIEEIIPYLELSSKVK